MKYRLIAPAAQAAEIAAKNPALVGAAALGAAAVGGAAVTTAALGAAAVGGAAVTTAALSTRKPADVGAGGAAAKPTPTSNTGGAPAEPTPEPPKSAEEELRMLQSIIDENACTKFDRLIRDANFQLHIWVQCQLLALATHMSNYADFLETPEELKDLFVDAMNLSMNISSEQKGGFGKFHNFLGILNIPWDSYEELIEKLARIQVLFARDEKDAKENGRDEGTAPKFRKPIRTVTTALLKLFGSLELLLKEMSEQIPFPGASVTLKTPDGDPPKGLVLERVQRCLYRVKFESGRVKLVSLNDIQKVSNQRFHLREFVKEKTNKLQDIWKRIEVEEDERVQAEKAAKKPSQWADLFGMLSAMGGGGG